MKYILKAWILNDIEKISYEKVEEPQLSETDVLVSVRAAGICGSDIPRIYLNGAHSMPLVLGHEFSGQVVKVGKRADQQWIGKRVGVFPLIPCKKCRQCMNGKYEMCSQYDYLGSRRNGGFAEYVSVPEWNLIELPENVSYEEAAMLEPMAVAVHAMKRVKFAQEDSVAVFGIGTIGQLVTMFLLEQSVKKILVIGNKEISKEAVMRLGIPEINYCNSRTEDIESFIMHHTEGNGVNVFFECVGKNETVSQAINLTAPAGEVCMVGNPYTSMTFDKDVYWKILRNQLSIIGTWNSSYSGNKLDECEIDDWRYVIEKLQKKQIEPTGLITHRFAMEDLEQGFHIMKDKSENYIKIMMVR